MDSKGNVIDLAEKRRQRKAKASKAPTKSKAPVLDMTERRNEIIQQERRRVRRTILTEFIGAFVVIPGQGLMKVTLYDISETGIAFDMDLDKGQFASGEEVAVRVYMNQNTYFPFTVKVKNLRTVDDESVVRHGANFILGTVNEIALFHFVKFIETVSASLEKDNGDVMVSNIK